MNADHQWLSDADPLWELTTSDGDYAALASEGPPPYDEDGDEDLSLRIVLRGDVALTLQTGAGGTAVEAVSELEFTGRELEDLYLALQRHFGHNEDRRILDRRQREQDEHQRVQEENRQRWEWEAWVDRHPWVIVAKNQQRGPNFTGYHGTIHARWCRYAPVTTYPNRDGYTTAEVTDLEQGRSVPRGDRTDHDPYRRVSRCKLCTGALGRESGQEQRDEQPAQHPTPIDLDAAD